MKSTAFPTLSELCQRHRSLEDAIDRMSQAKCWEVANVYDWKARGYLACLLELGQIDKSTFSASHQELAELIMRKESRQ